MMMFSMDDMVPQNHMLRLIDRAIDWNFIYDLVEEKYCPDNGRPSMDPVMLIKIPFIQYLYGIKSMRQTMKEIEVNVAYRWFLGLDMLDPVPHFSTFGKNYTRRFKDTDLFEQIFSKILEDCMKYKLVNTEQIFVDATHVKACANSKKMRKRVAHEQALWYEEELNKEIEKDRLAHGKKPLKKKDDNQPPASGGTGNDKDSISEELPEDVKTQKYSISDPESGWFRKGEHKHVFAYAVETACDKHGWILGYTVHPGNEHDSRTFKALYDKISKLNPQMVVADAGYKTPAIAHRLLEDGIQPLFPYTPSQDQRRLFRKTRISVFPSPFNFSLLFIRKFDSLNSIFALRLALIKFLRTTISLSSNFVCDSFSLSVLGQALKRLVTVSSMCCHTSTSALSTSYSSRVFTSLKEWDISSWGGTSRLDAFSVYSFRTWLPGDAIGMTAGTPVVRPARSSRTKASSPQISYARAG